MGTEAPRDRPNRLGSLSGMTSHRPAAVAGSFYPSDPVALRSTVTALLSAEPTPEIGVEPRMLIVPHAGYRYSGPTAATAYRCLTPYAATDPRVVIIGPSHFVPFAGIAGPGVDAFETPLGDVPVDPLLATAAEERACVHPDRMAHGREHSLEVQLPFLQVALDSFTFYPMLTGDVSGETAADVLEDVIDTTGAVALISSDLSHYLDYETSGRRDRRTSENITSLRPEMIGPDDACGRTAIQASLLVARRRGWACLEIARSNSGDTAGSRDSVVGYGAFAIGPMSD